MNSNDSTSAFGTSRGKLFGRAGNPHNGGATRQQGGYGQHSDPDRQLTAEEDGEVEAIMR